MDKKYLQGKTLKKELDLLITDRYPIEYFDRVKIRLDNDNVIAIDESGDRIIPIETTMMLFLGGGCSISIKALERCSKAGCLVVGGNAGVKIHTIWSGGRWYEPKTNINQVKKVIDSNEKLKIAKFFTKVRMIRDNNLEYIEQVISASSIEEILGYEAAAYKKIYRKLALEQNVNFKRNFNIKNNDFVNERLNVLNNCLYSYITSIILTYGLNPSIGFSHGISRRGGLAFDFADIFKLNYSLIPSFSNPQKTTRELMLDLSNKVQQRSHLFSRQILELCRLIGSNIFEESDANLKLIFKDLEDESDYSRFFNR